MMYQDLERIVMTKDQIQEVVAKMGKEITEDYKGKELLVVGVLNGGVYITVDLSREIKLPIIMDFVGASSYGDTVVSGDLRMTKTPSIDPKGKDVLIVEDILDSGRTLKKMMEYYQELGANSVKLCVLLDKPDAHKVDVQADYVGANVGNEFIVGYGLDYAQKYRNLADIGVLKREIYE